MLSSLLLKSSKHRSLLQNFNAIRFASSLVIGDLKEGVFTKNTLSALSASSQLGDTSLLLCNNALNESTCQSLCKDINVKDFYFSNSSDPSSYLPENYCNLLQQLQEQHHFDYIIGCSTITTKSLLARFAAKQNTYMLSDVIHIINNNTFQRFVYAGNVLETIQVTSSPLVMTIRPSRFIPIDKSTASSTPSIHKLECTVDKKYTTFKEECKTQSNRPDLSQAERVVVGGRGVGTKEQFGVIYELADKLHAAVGGTRAVVDQEMIEADLQVGQTGKVISPSLYIGCGVSGSIQHQAGMKDSQTIVCINKDPEAPLFNIADFGIVGDLHSVVPELISKL